MSRWHPDQGALALPVPPRPEPDYPALARAELTVALASAKAAVDRTTWDRKRCGWWRIVFPQMAGWLPDGEREPMVAEFLSEMERVERLLPNEERESEK